MVKAEYLTFIFPNVYKVRYNKQPVYNVLLKQHSTMIINNLVVETMYPEHILAKISSGNYTPEQKHILIKSLNKYNSQNKKSFDMRNNIFIR